MSTKTEVFIGILIPSGILQRVLIISTEESTPQVSVLKHMELSLGFLKMFVLQYKPISSLDPSRLPMVVLDQSDASLKYKSRSVPLLTPLLCTTKLRSSKERKVIQILVSDVQYLF